MVYAFSGAHRSGKTTLAKAVAEDLGVMFHETKTGEVLKAAGIDIVANMTIGERMVAQEYLLDHHVKTIEALPRPLIVDRCPIDMMAYTLAEIGMHTLTDPELDKRINDYVGKCLAATNMHYMMAVVTRPLPFYVVEEGKPPPSKTYQWHIQTIIEGGFDLVADNIMIATMAMTDFVQRRHCAAECIADAMDSLDQAAKEARLH